MAVVGILGMTHDEEMQKKYNYPLSLVEELIIEFKPDVICGVHPLSWELYLNNGVPQGILGETQKE
ncbi:hypothetical protein [Fictibacillus norfolkensis]|uniref:Fe/B12 periplasmic-binding domain-containing protein n=1 Tax=Fictibacillus norfolkensis TaxID=2762233 RepID=A0ABR8SH05_9BACL|nr:hypothetical protein [Fictibacillus norfolkensis]MBD7962771.1 hypothetical protein [Fictibacillus norfolkensis]